MNAQQNKAGKLPHSPEELVTEATSWADAGPGEAAWNDWIGRATTAFTSGVQDGYSRHLRDLVERNRDGLSTVEWAEWLQAAKAYVKAGKMLEQPPGS